MSDQSSMEKTSKELLEIVRKRFQKLGFNVLVNIYGSVSRGTWLAQEKDIDVFASFPTHLQKKELESSVTEVGSEVLSQVEKRFAEHPYVKGKFKGYNVEIIPCYSVEDPALRLSAVDRSPFHDEFVKKHLKGRQDEVRILKQFIKGVGCYGAETKVEGFSGYLCELLILHFGSFEKVVEAASIWIAPISIDMTGKGDPSMFPNSSLIFIDPTDIERNVASALSREKLSTFIYACKRYQKSPDSRFFFPKERVTSEKEALNLFKARGTHVVAITFKTPFVIDDILYPQLRKAIRLFEKILIKSDFNLMESGFYVEENTAMVFELLELKLPNSRTHIGPPFNSKNEDDFISKHKGSNKALSKPFIKDGRWIVILKRSHTNAVELLDAFCNRKGLKSKGVPSHIAASVEKGFKIKVDSEAVKNQPGFYIALFDPMFPWEVRG